MTPGGARGDADVTDTTRHRVGVGLLVGGVAVAVLGFAGYTLGIGESTSTSQGQAADGGSATTSTTEAEVSTTTTTTVPAETPQQFLAELQAAERAGDAAFLVAAPASRRDRAIRRGRVPITVRI